MGEGMGRGGGPSCHHLPALMASGAGLSHLPLTQGSPQGM